MKQIDIFNLAKTQKDVGEWFEGSNPKIIEYHSTTLLNADDDAIPWCSSFVNWCCVQAGVEGTNSAAARSWLKWGIPVEQPQTGDIIILNRGISKSQAHVGFFENVYMDGVNRPEIKVFGGNQGDKVKSSWFPVSHVLGYRRLA